MNEKLLSKGQAANYLGISSLKLDYLRKEGEVAFIKICTRVLFRVADLQHFIQRNRQESSQNEEPRTDNIPC